jgi:hypothetical protein
MSQDATTATNPTKETKPKNKEPYQQAYYPPVPTGFTRFMRSNLVWQFWRFLVINLKIFRLMFRSHH